jgi:hypothetical protein
MKIIALCDIAPCSLFEVDHGYFCGGTRRNAVPKCFSEGGKPERRSGTFTWHWYN